MDLISQDVRYSVRAIRNTAPLSLAVVITLTAGVTLNALVFSLFNAILFRPPVPREPSSFVSIYPMLSGHWHREIHAAAYAGTLEEFEVIRRATRTLSAVTAAGGVSLTLGNGGPVLRGQYTSCNYLSAHVGPMIVGRGFVEAECASPGGEPVVVLSERVWDRHFGRDPAIVGRTVRLSDRPLTVIGVAPDAMAIGPVLPLLYVPYTMQSVFGGSVDFFRAPRDRHAWLSLGGRLRPGSSHALEALRLGPSRMLTSGRGAAGTVSGALRGTLIANQLSISLALLIVMGLIVRAQDRLFDTTLDFDADATLMASVDLTRAGYSGSSARTFYDRLADSRGPRRAEGALVRPARRVGRPRAQRGAMIRTSETAHRDSARPIWRTRT